MLVAVHIRVVGKDFRVVPELELGVADQVHVFLVVRQLTAIAR